MSVLTKQVIKPFERRQIFVKRMTQVVQTDAKFLGTASKQLGNGIPFENGKPFVYVFLLLFFFNACFLYNFHIGYNF